MVQYKRFKNPNAIKARGKALKVSFKKTRETAMAVRGMDLRKAEAYLNDVLAQKQIIPFRRFNKGVGRKAQCKNVKWPNGRWPTKSTQVVLSMLQNIRSNAEAKGVDADSLVITHTKVDAAPESRRSTFRAHGRITAFQAHPAHVEIMCTPRAAPVRRGAGKRVARRSVKA